MFASLCNNKIVGGVGGGLHFFTFPYNSTTCDGYNLSTSRKYVLAAYSVSLWVLKMHQLQFFYDYKEYISFFAKEMPE